MREGLDLLFIATFGVFDVGELAQGGLARPELDQPFQVRAVVLGTLSVLVVGSELLTSLEIFWICRDESLEQLDRLVDLPELKV